MGNIWEFLLQTLTVSLAAVELPLTTYWLSLIVKITAARSGLDFMVGYCSMLSSVSLFPASQSGSAVR